MLETVSSGQAFGVLMEPWECMLIAEDVAISGADLLRRNLRVQRAVHPMNK